MNKSNNYLGVDVSKETLQVDVFDRKPCCLANTSADIKALVKRIKAHGDVIVCCEATGGYEKLLVAHLRAADIPVAVVVPKRVRDFARSKGILAKTDKIDARVLTLFGTQNQPEPTPPLAEEIVQLQEALIRREELIDIRKQEQNRLEGCPSSITSAMIKKHIRFIDNQLKLLEKEMDRLLRDHQELKKKTEQLTAVKAVGRQTALHLIAFVPELGRVSGNEAAALVGVAPFNCDSGTMKGRRMIQGGRSRVRRVLYMAAVCASQRNPILRDVYQRMINQGKPAKVALVAIMRKIVVLANRIFSEPDFKPA